MCVGVDGESSYTLSTSQPPLHALLILFVGEEECGDEPAPALHN
jgi:hypothetical protein